MSILKNLFLALLASAPLFLHAQYEDEYLEEGPVFVEETFRTFRLVYGHSSETVWRNNLMFSVSHRFGGTVNEGIDELFGLDGEANIRLALAYGIFENLTVGVGRSRVNKLYDGFIKYRFLRQKEEGWPVTMTALVSAAIRTRPYPDEIQEQLEFRHKMSYFSQLIVASRLFPFVSVQLTPSVTHQNLAEEKGAPNTIFAFGGGVRFRITDGIAVLAEYTHPFMPSFETDRPGKDVIGFGVDFTTPRHSFQLQVSNTTGLIGQAYIPNTTGEFFNGDIHIGFNISRKFGL